MNSRFEDTYFKQNHTLRYKDKLIPMDRALVMGILNLTSDSFYEQSRIADERQFLKSAEKLLNAGADILDIGAVSSRPGAALISETDELKRLVPAVQLIHKEFPEVLLSVDTFRSRVADEVLMAGAGIINDISGFQFDSDLPEIIAKHQATYVLMHVKGDFNTMHSSFCGEHYLSEMAAYLFEKIAILRKAGVNDIILDPGFGFSKTMKQNFDLLSNLHYFQHLEAPLLVGISRKSMIYKTLEGTPETALAGTIALNTIALLKGASILRVHDPAEAHDVIRLLQHLG
jgi:dihydropteroate synthase